MQPRKCMQIKAARQCYLFSSSVAAVALCANRAAGNGETISQECYLLWLQLYFISMQRSWKPVWSQRVKTRGRRESWCCQQIIFLRARRKHQGIIYARHLNFHQDIFTSARFFMPVWLCIAKAAHQCITIRAILRTLKLLLISSDAIPVWKVKEQLPYFF